MKRNENKKSLTKKIVAGTGLALLLALVGYTGANTYAKYITEGQVASQTATVAKWGVVLNATTDDAFGGKYSKVDGQSEAVIKDTGLSVSATSNRVAPGTTGSITFSISGEPEVATKVSFKMADDFKDVNAGTYYPIEWTFTGDGFDVTGTLEDIHDYLNDGTHYKEYAPGNAINGQTYTLSWVWVFEHGSTPDEKAQYNELDTYLGNVAAEKVSLTDGDSIDVDFTINATVEQIQK